MKLLPLRGQAYACGGQEVAGSSIWVASRSPIEPYEPHHTRLPDKITPTPSAAPIFKLDRELRIERHKPLALNPLYIDFTTFDDNI